MAKTPSRPQSQAWKRTLWNGPAAFPCHPRVHSTSEEVEEGLHSGLGAGPKALVSLSLGPFCWHLMVSSLRSFHVGQAEV